MKEASLLSDINNLRLQDVAHNNESLDEIATQISSSSATEKDLHDAALTAYAYLRELDSEASKGAQDDFLNLTKSIADVLLFPSSRLLPKPPTLTAELGLACLYLISSKFSVEMNDEFLLAAVAYIDARDSWTSENGAETASKLLDNQLTTSRREEFITRHVLKDTLKPLFTKPSTRLTESGRPALYETPVDRHQGLAPAATWKTKSPWAKATLRWAVKASDSQLVEHHWPLFTPVLLALAEDDESLVRSRGLEILADFIKVCPGKVLQTTGIGSIFEQVAFPTLLYIPSITPESESTQLLTPAYDVLVALVEAYQDPKDPDRRRLLDKVLREGIFAGYQHASQYARIVEILMNYMAVVINCLGIYAVKHLQTILSIYSDVMTDPFALTHPPAVLAAAKGLNALISNCWPRVQAPGRVEQIIRIISLCWLNTEDEKTSSSAPKDILSTISKELTQTSKMLRALWEQDGTGPPPRLKEVITQEPRLANLFPPSIIPSENK